MAADWSIGFLRLVKRSFFTARPKKKSQRWHWIELGTSTRRESAKRNPRRALRSCLAPPHYSMWGRPRHRPEELKVQARPIQFLLRRTVRSRFREVARAAGQTFTGSRRMDRPHGFGLRMTILSTLSPSIRTGNCSPEQAIADISFPST